MKHSNLSVPWSAQRQAQPRTTRARDQGPGRWRSMVSVSTAETMKVAMSLDRALTPDPGGLVLPSRVHAVVLVSRLHKPALQALVDQVLRLESHSRADRHAAQRVPRGRVDERQIQMPREQDQRDVHQRVVQEHRAGQAEAVRARVASGRGPTQGSRRWAALRPGLRPRAQAMHRMHPPAKRAPRRTRQRRR